MFLFSLLSRQAKIHSRARLRAGGERPFTGLAIPRLRAVVEFLFATAREALEG